MRQALYIFAILLVSFAYTQSAVQDLINQNVPVSKQELARQAFQEMKELEDVSSLSDEAIKKLIRQALPKRVPASVRAKVFNNVKTRPVTPSDYESYLYSCSMDYGDQTRKTQQLCFREINSCVKDTSVTNKDELWACLDQAIANHSSE